MCDEFLIGMLPRLPIMTRIIYSVNYNLTVWPFQNFIVTFNSLSLDPNETVGVLSKLTDFVFYGQIYPLIYSHLLFFFLQYLIQNKGESKFNHQKNSINPVLLVRVSTHTFFIWVA